LFCIGISNNDDPLPEIEIANVVKSAFKNDLGINNRELERSDFMNFDDRKKVYSEYIKDIENKKIDIGFELIDQKIRGIRPGNILTLLAETSAGKSATVQNILQKYTKKTEKHTLYISLEMDSYEIHERETQIEFNVSGYDVEEAYLKDKANFNSLHLNKFITLTDSIDINKLYEIVEKCKEYFGEIGLIAIDHVGIMDNKIFNDNEYSRITDVMKKIKRFALCSKYPVIVISQVNRMEALKKSDRLSLFSGKGTGEIENSSNVVLALEKITAENYSIFKYQENIINADIVNSYNERGINLLCLSILKKQTWRIYPKHT
jgi:replicative DNA helicase